MKKSISRIIFISFVAVALSAGLLSNQSARAQSQPPIVVGVVDFDSILQKSKSGQGLKASLKKAEEGFKAEVAKQEKAFRDAEAKLKSEQGSMSEDELKKKLTDLQADMQAANKKFQDKEQQLEARRNKALDVIRDALNDVILVIAKERGMTLVLNKFNVVFTAEDYDFTAEALKRLDAKLPSVKL